MKPRKARPLGRQHRRPAGSGGSNAGAARRWAARMPSCWPSQVALLEEFAWMVARECDVSSGLRGST